MKANYFRWPFTLTLLILFEKGNCQYQPCPYDKIDKQHLFNYTCDGDLIIHGKIDGGSDGSLSSYHGSCIIEDKIDGGSSVSIKCAGNLIIADKIDGGSSVTITAGGYCSIGNKIDNGSTHVVIRCKGDIRVIDKIDGGCHVKLYSETGHVHIKEIGNSNTEVRYHSPYAIQVDGKTDSAPIRIP
jgi:hypothetical protein